MRTYHRIFVAAVAALAAGNLSAAAIGLIDSVTQQPIPDADARYAGSTHAAEHAAGGTDPVSLSAAQITSGEFPDARVADTITAGQLAADPTPCPGGQFVTDLSAAGVLTCATPPAGSSTTFDGGTYTEVTFGANITLVDDGDGSATVNVSAGTATLGDGNYGDVTVSSGGTVITINLGAVGVSKLASADFGDFTCNGTTCTLDQAYLTAETDPVYSADPAAGITAQDILDWDAAFGWGDHALAGYLTTVASTDITDSTAAGRAILTAADAAAQRALLNVEDGATADQTAAEVPVTLTPTNYTAATADVEAHLVGINDALTATGGTDLGISTDPAQITILSSTGQNAVMPNAGDGNYPGLMTADQRSQLANVWADYFNFTQGTELEILNFTPDLALSDFWTSVVNGIDDALALRPLATDIAAGAITPAAGNLDLTGSNGQVLVLDLAGNVVAGTLTDAAMTRVPDPTAGSVESWWRNPMAYDASIVAIWCESDQTVNLDVQVDDGTPADVAGTDIACTSTPAATTVLSGDTIVSSGETLDIAITSVSGAPTWLSLQVVVEYQ